MWTCKRLITLKQGKVSTVQDRSGKCLTEEREILYRWTELLWAVQSQGQRRSINTELSPDTRRGWPPHSSQRSGGCTTTIEERGVSWSRQHPSRTGQSRWRGCNHRSHNNLQQDLADRRMANPIDPVISHHTSQERQPAAVPELPNNKLHQSPKRSHAEDNT